ncbi:MAG: hypothetical protein KBT40_04070 [bacterium]|nr:hypothetical protein [Candidatus Minthenecus merdequi]
MKTKILLVLMFTFAFSLSSFALFGKQKQIRTTPSTAQIYIDGNYVGDGMYSVKFKNEDFVVVKVENTGYVTKEFRLYKEDSRNTIGVQLVEDDALAGSTATDLANRYFTIQVREGINVDKAWKLLSQVMLDYFNELKTADKASGYMNTTWVKETFPNAKVKIRTMVQIKEVSGDGLTYQIKIFSEIADIDSNDQGYKPWPRVLKKYETLINEMQMRVGKN